MDDSPETLPEGSDPDAVYDPRPIQRSRAFQIHSYSDTGHDLTVEEQLFCRSFIIDRNGVAALRRLGYAEESNATLKARAERFLRSSEVQDCVKVLADRMMQNLDITAEKVNREVARIAFFDLTEVMEFDHNGVQIMHSKFWNENQRAAIAGVKMTKDGVELKVHDKQKALDFLGKQMNLLGDEREMARAAAEGAARAAMDKILEVTERMRPQVPAIEDKSDDQPTVQ
jgi:phage terminase small subunit